MPKSRASSTGWTYDSHILWQESYALLPLAAAQTKTLKLGHCVTESGHPRPDDHGELVRDSRTSPRAGW